MTNENHSTSGETKEISKENKSIRFHIIAAIFIFIFDALFLCQGGIAFLVLAAFVIIGAFKTLNAIRKKNLILRTPLKLIGVYSICFLAVITTIWINNKIARNRAEVVITAIKQYKTKYNHYPETLQNLVPEFLPSVPKAKYSFESNKFYYSRLIRESVLVDKNNKPIIIESVLLNYTDLPPFGRPTYSFEQNEWGYID